jgi:hypothetical protein
LGCYHVPGGAIGKPGEPHVGSGIGMIGGGGFGSVGSVTGVGVGSAGGSVIPPPSGLSRLSSIMRLGLNFMTNLSPSVLEGVHEFVAGGKRQTHI